MASRRRGALLIAAFAPALAVGAGAWPSTAAAQTLEHVSAKHGAKIYKLSHGHRVYVGLEPRGQLFTVIKMSGGWCTGFAGAPINSFNRTTRCANLATGP